MYAYHHQDPYKDCLILGEDPHSSSSRLSSDSHSTVSPSEPAHYVLSSPRCAGMLGLTTHYPLCPWPSALSHPAVGLGLSIPTSGLPLLLPRNTSTSPPVI